MDATRFDRLTVALGRRLSRRGFAGAMALAAPAAAVARSEAAAQTCLPEGASCADSDLWCCGDLYCVNGACQRFVGPGEICYSSAECSPSQSSSYVCEYNGSWHGQPVCCGYAGAGCGNDFDCCGDLTCSDGMCGSAPVSIYGGAPCASDEWCGGPGSPLICDDNGTYHDGPLHCCLPPGGWCMQHADCCWQGLCIDGYCA